MQFWQLGESHYWGHNAIIRVEPFMQHCALAPSRARGLAGGIMSHDFVEAALMRRAGYHVWLVADLVGSYEQQPPTCWPNCSATAAGARATCRTRA
jgi:membrane glycosyltransferase